MYCLIFCLHWRLLILICIITQTLNIVIVWFSLSTMKGSAQYLKDGRSTNIFCNKHDFSWDKTEVSKLRYNHLHHHQRDNVTKFVVESGKRIFMIYTTKENNVNTSSKFMWPWHTYTLHRKNQVAAFVVFIIPRI